MSGRRTLARRATHLLTAGLSFLLSVAACSRNSAPESGLSFSRENWRSVKPSTRADQAREYLSRVRPGDMTLREVLADLGEPDFVREEWTYELGGPDLREEDLPVCSNCSRRHRPQLGIWFDLDRIVQWAWTTVHEPAVGSDFAPGRPEAADRWAATDADERQAIAWALARGDQLLGWRQEDVRRLLGEPSSNGGGMEVSYKVGVVKSWVDTDPLNLRFMIGEHDVVTGASIQ